jgi:hypothetical protein
MSTVKRMFILIMMLLLLLLPGLARDAGGAAQLSGTRAAADTPWEIDYIEGVGVAAVNIGVDAVGFSF